MKLASFIASNRELILEAWQHDAVNRAPPEDHGGVGRLRDHLGELLVAIATDLEAADSGGSLEGHDRARWSSVEALATKHGAGRADDGFTVTQLVPEFPALRFCASHLWFESQQQVTTEDLADLVRFDEAIDFALTCSVDEFMERLNRSRETFLGVLGHDLRDPLSTMITGAKLLREDNIDERTRCDIAGRIASTGERMQQLVADLLDFTQARLGGRMPIERRDADLARVVRAVADEFASSHPDRPIRLDVTGDVNGCWDAKRVSQAVGNLLGNALHHGAAASPIDVSARADEVEATIVVHNEGPAIPADKQSHLFEPISPAKPNTNDTRHAKHLGLGLYITKAIVTGHGGRIDVDSSPMRGTTFTVHLPRHSDGDTPVDLGHR